MCKYYTIHGEQYFVSKDFEEMHVLRCLLNPRKHHLFFPSIELLIPCGEIPFSPAITTEGKILRLMGQEFKIETSAIPSWRARSYNVKVNTSILSFFTDVNCFKRENLLAVRL